MRRIFLFATAIFLGNQTIAGHAYLLAFERRFRHN